MIREGRNVINMIIPLQLGADAMILILIINGTRTYLSAEGNICCTEITVNCCCCMCVFSL